MTFAPRLVLVAAFPLLAFASPALAQDASMKICGEKWQAAKAAGTTNGATWPKFLAECRAGGASAGAPAAAQASAPAPSRVAEPAEASQQPARPASPAVFPAAVSPKFADLRPAQARQKTCSEQYQANKASGANGGLRWRAKDGYWSQCNRRLKGV